MSGVNGANGTNGVLGANANAMLGVSLEEKAERAYALAFDDPGKAGIVEMHEMVALGFVQSSRDVLRGEPEVVWYELTNVAEPNADGRGEFFVDGEELRRVMLQADAEGHFGCPVVLWHTHIGTASPSAEDIAEFPEWLAQVGIVYHVPSGKSTTYNAAGIISNSSGPATTLATDGNA